MQRQSSILTAFAATIAIGIAASNDGNLRPLNAELSEPSPMTVTTQIAAASVLASGEFVKSEHSTSGTAQIFIQDGQKYLKFDSSFKSDSGPDLFVLLHRQSSPQRYHANDYVNLGRLKKVAGQQMYQIPDRVDVSKFKSVVIWCRQFNATFGFAPLG